MDKKGSTGQMGTARRTRRPPEERRRQIVETATNLIAQAGFNAVSISDIAAACGVAKSLVLYYFPSMQQLLVAVLVHRDHMAQMALPGIGSAPAKPAEARQLAMEMIEHSISYPELVRLYHVVGAESLSPNHPAHEYFEDRGRQLIQFCEAMFCWKPDPHQAALTFIAFFEGIERLWLRDSSMDIVSIFQKFVDDFIKPE